MNTSHSYNKIQRNTVSSKYLQKHEELIAGTYIELNRWTILMLNS